MDDEEIIGFDALWDSMMKCKRGGISRKKVDESYRCWRECASKGDGYRMLRNMDKYYQSLWENENVKDYQAGIPIGGRGNNQSAESRE